MRPWLNLLLVSLWFVTVTRTAAAAENDAAASRGVIETLAERRVDINHASVEELCTLPGISKKRAEAIVRYRERKPFTRVTQLLNIRGIGRKTLRKLRPRLALTPMIAVKGKARRGQVPQKKSKVAVDAAVERPARGCPRAEKAGGARGKRERASTVTADGNGSR